MRREVEPSTAGLSPAMRQYQQFKAQYPGYVLFFRMGDFYEMFWDDAVLASKVLGVALTSRSRGGINAHDAIPMAGVPYHSVDGYLRRMIAAGHKVAICEQTEDAALAKGLVKRDVVRLMTPGTLTEDPLLDGRSENLVCAIALGVEKSRGYRAGLAWIELSTGACAAMSGAEPQMLDELVRLDPAEVLVPELPSGQPHPIEAQAKSRGVRTITRRAGWQFTTHFAQQKLREQWGVRAAAGFGFEADDPAVQAIGACVAYLEETQKTSISHLQPPRRHAPDDFLQIDPSSWKSLEVDRTVRSGGVDGSLLNAIDRTRTVMGARLLRCWLRHPLTDLDHLNARQAAVAALYAAPEANHRIGRALESVSDLERILGRITVNRATPRDLVGLRQSLSAVPELLEGLLRVPEANLFDEISAIYDKTAAVHSLLALSILDAPATHLREGGVIREGFDAELDRLRSIGQNSAQWLVEYQGRLASETGISSLKVAYNRVFGYYIEVTDTYRGRTPASWVRKQTVKNAERYITDELKSFEDEALGARDRSIQLEQQLFERIRQEILPSVPPLQELAQALARLDVLAALARLALERRYCRPELVEDRVLKIEEGRHPVLEQRLGEEFIANDTTFGENDSLALITGPNMAGKSTYIRQVALIVLLAQVGSFVPAKRAVIGVADRLFARIGASDELHAGQSTFMVEMTEAACILNSATAKSVVILDEIGRGTSTLDGLSLAWAMTEHIAGRIGCRTLFATHYHELTELEGQVPGIRNYNIAVREWEDQVIFLHRIVEGGTDRSYGIHVARLAGVPRKVLERARQLLGGLVVQQVSRRRARPHADPSQLSLFPDAGERLLAELRELDLLSMSPLQAHEWLREAKQKLDRESQ